MSWLVLGLVALAALAFLGRGFVAANPARTAATLRFAGGVACIGIAIVLGLTGRWAIAVPVGLFGVSLLGYGSAWSGRTPRREDAPGLGRKRSTVATAVLEVELDHGSGDVSGRVVSGPFAGSNLDALALRDLLGLRRSIDPRDRESLSLLDAYLDRREPGWREDLERDADAGQGRASRPGAMSTQEAYETLGLRPGATEDEVRDAHRRLIKRLHPDVGGSAALAAKINEAKERLLGGRRER